MRVTSALCFRRAVQMATPDTTIGNVNCERGQPSLRIGRPVADNVASLGLSWLTLRQLALPDLANRVFMDCSIDARSSVAVRDSFKLE